MSISLTAPILNSLSSQTCLLTPSISGACVPSTPSATTADGQPPALSVRLRCPLNLSSPANDARTRSHLQPSFDWQDVPDATSYTIQISKYSSLTKPFLSKKVTSSEYLPTNDLLKNKTVYWRVRANGDNGPSAWSQVWSLKTPNAPGRPSLISPSNNGLVKDLKPRLDWKNSSLPSGTSFDHYQLQVASDSDFSALVTDVNISDRSNSEFTFLSDLSPNTKYFWRVRAFNTLGHYSRWSTTRSFREALLAPILSSPPMDSSTDSDLRPLFDWQDVPDATSYTIQISKYSSLTKPFLSKKVTSSEYLPTNNLPKNKTVYWRARANGDNGPSAWSQIWPVSTTPNPEEMSTQSSSNENQNPSLPAPQVEVISENFQIRSI